MGLILAVLFIGIPALEIALLVKVGGAIGAGWTFLLVVATGIAGAAIARHQGVAALQEVQGAMSSGRRIGRAMASAAMVLVGAVLLVTPGFVTDAAGLLLLIPVVRHPLGAFLAARFGRRAVHRVVVPGGFGPEPEFREPEVREPGSRGPGDERERQHEPPPPGVIDV